MALAFSALLCKKRCAVFLNTRKADGESDNAPPFVRLARALGADMFFDERRGEGGKGGGGGGGHGRSLKETQAAAQGECIATGLRVVASKIVFRVVNCVATTILATIESSNRC